MKSKLILQIISLVLYCIVIGLTIYWGEWKTLCLIFLFVLANNCSLEANVLSEIKKAIRYLSTKK